MSCIYFDTKLQKPIPCTVVPNKINIHDHMEKRYYLISVEYDEISLNEYGITMNQVLKYLNDYIDIHELYPIEDIDYFNSCISLKTVNVSKELARYEKLYSFISNVPNITSDILYHLCNFFITDLQFKYLTYEERIFMKSLSDSEFTEVPPVILVPICLKMLLNLFDKYNGLLFEEHIVENYNNYSKYSIIFPLKLNVFNIKYNMNLIRLENPELFT